MKIEFNSQTSFKRRLKPAEEKEFSEILQQGKKAVGNTGMSTLIIPSSSLPQTITTNTGVGNLLNKESNEFFNFAKQYWGIDTVQLLPEGNFKLDGKRILPYSSSSLDFGNQLINLELLTKDEFGKIINETDLKTLINSNTASLKDTVINYEHVVSPKSPTENLLKKGFNELLKADTDAKRELLKNFEKFELEHVERLEPKSLFYALSDSYNSADTRKWSHIDHNLFDTDVISEVDRNARIKQIKEAHPFETRFYKFKQFLAENHLELAKESLNKKGLKLSGDMICGFSYDERWANPKAFYPFKYSIGWGLPAINLETAEGEALLRKKIKHHAKHYDKLRIDAAWIYSSEPLKINKELVDIKEHGRKFIDIIEEEFKNIKGPAFKNEDIMYELIADSKLYSPFGGSYLKPEIKDRVKIYCSDSMSKNWGSVEAFKKIQKWENGSYIMGISNHDSEIYKVLEDNVRFNKQKDVLADILKIPKEKLSSTKEFIKAKYAEIIRSEHNMFFFTDILNLDGKYQSKNSTQNFRIKIPEKYQDHYFKSLEKGEGLNIMDALEKAFKAEGLDKTHSDLYKKIQKYKKILQEPNGLAKNKVVAILLSSIIAISAISIGAASILKTSKPPQDMT